MTRPSPGGGGNDIRSTVGLTPNAATTAAHRRKRQTQFFNVGVIGRKTGITLNDTGVRDENGIEPLDGLFSSPAKVDYRSVSRERSDVCTKVIPGSSTSHALENPTISSITQQKQQHERKSMLPPPVGRSPIKTNIGSTPRRPLNLGRRKQPQTSLSPELLSVPRRLEFYGTNSPPSRRSWQATSPSNELMNRRKQIETRQSFSSGRRSLSRSSSNILAKGYNWETSEESIPCDHNNINTVERSTINTNGRRRSTSNLRSSQDSRSVESTVLPDYNRSRELGARSLSVRGTGIKSTSIAETIAQGNDPRRLAKRSGHVERYMADDEDEDDDEDEEEEEVNMSEELERNEEDIISSTILHDSGMGSGIGLIEGEVEEVEGEEEDEDKNERKHEKAAANAKSKDKVNARMNAKDNGRNKSTKHESSKKPAKQEIKPSGKDSTTVTRNTRRNKRGENNTAGNNDERQVDLESKDIGGSIRTRSGRVCIQPVDWWRGERVERAYDGSIQGVKRTEVGKIDGDIVNNLKRKRLNPQVSSRGASKLSGKGKNNKYRDDYYDDDDDDTEEEWERKGQVISGRVVAWDGANSGGTGEEYETELAYGRRTIETREVAGSKFKFGKYFVMPFFGTGLVEIPKGGMKREKNARHMHIVFFVHTGRVRVKVGVNTVFVIGRGGVWTVPRGNSYSIENLCGTARLFFAQACEVLADPEW